MSVLHGKTALVTGGGRGIGRAIAERLGRDGARVGIHYGHGERAAVETMTAIAATGGDAFTVQADLAGPGAAAQLRQGLAGHIDGLDLPSLRDSGRVINLSANLTRGSAEGDLAAYAMSKAAVDAFTLALAKDLGPRSITVNAVAPGVVDTDMNAGWLRQDQARAFVSALSPLGRVAGPGDIAGIVAFLASGDSGWLTGQWIEASGGAGL